MDLPYLGGFEKTLDFIGEFKVPLQELEKPKNAPLFVICSECNEASPLSEFNYIYIIRGGDENAGLYEVCPICLVSTQASSKTGVPLDRLTRLAEFGIPSDVWRGLVRWMRLRDQYFKNLNLPRGTVSIARGMYEIFCAIILGAMAINGFKGKEWDTKG